MTTVNNYYEQAQFSLAAYGDLSNGMAINDYVSVLQDVEMGEAQATQFATDYEIVDRKYDDTGYSATVFKNRATGELTAR